jgi:hypothetical protein
MDESFKMTPDVIVDLAKTTFQNFKKKWRAQENPLQLRRITFGMQYSARLLRRQNVSAQALELEGKQAYQDTESSPAP